MIKKNTNKVLSGVHLGGYVGGQAVCVVGDKATPWPEANVSLLLLLALNAGHRHLESEL